MDLNLSSKKCNLSPEQIDNYKKQLSAAKPYTLDEIVAIPYDSCDFDFDRLNAHVAQRALKEAGILCDE